MCGWDNVDLTTVFILFIRGNSNANFDFKFGMQNRCSIFTFQTKPFDAAIDAAELGRIADHKITKLAASSEMRMKPYAYNFTAIQNGEI